MDDLLERAARAIQTEYLATGFVSEFSEKEKADDFIKHKDMYLRMADAALAEAGLKAKQT